MSTDAVFLPAKALAKALAEVRQRGYFKNAQQVSDLCDQAQECVRHFSDGRKTAAFVLVVVLEGLGDEYDRQSKSSPAQFRSLLARLAECANGLSSAPDPDLILKSVGNLIDAANDW